MTTAHDRIHDLLAFIDASPSPWHAVASIAHRLQAFGFRRLTEQNAWSLHAGGRYYVVRDDSSIIIFVVGKQALANSGFKIIGAHTDSPGFRVKPQPQLYSDGLQRLALEVYGSPIIASFADRELSLAGRLAYLDNNGAVASCLVNIDQPLLRLPNLAIHMNRGVNDEGLRFNKQSELAALLGQSLNNSLSDSFIAHLSRASGISAEALLSWDLAVYDTQKGSVWGADQAFYSDSQLDNLASCHAGLSALLDEAILDSDSTLVCGFFDHEEIGSESANGAAGSFLPDVLQRIAHALDDNPESYRRALANSFMISTDMAHAYHPNYAGSYECNHKLMVNHGPAIKVNANHRYASECVSEAQFMALCRQAEVPFQKYAHRGDLPCGSTIGPITAAKLGIRTVDVGNPMWAMHSVRESAGVFDHDYLIRALHCFFANNTD
jgi:aspartyl aminopeptidase